MFEVIEELTGQKIKAIRKYLGMTQTEFSVAIGNNVKRGQTKGKQVELIQVSRWELGYTLPSIANLEAISIITGITINDIIDEEVSIKQIEEIMLENGISKVAEKRKKTPKRKLNEKVQISAEEIKQLRSDLKMTQVEFAEYVEQKSLSVNPPTGVMVSGWENGRVIPNIDHEKGLLIIQSQVKNNLAA